MSDVSGEPNVQSRSSPGTPIQELTLPAILLGIALSIIMGAANVYLGLKVGMTVAASIPAAVVAMAILHGLMRRKSLLESNIVQTGASAGESLAAGIIFTMPALVMIGVWESFNFWITTLIAMTGGLLGVLFMIPMRKVFVVDNAELKYPEGVACAEVLRAGEGSEDGAKGATSSAALLFISLGVGGVFKFAGSFLGLFSSSVEFARFAGSRIFVFGCDIAPALVGVGYIVGLGIASQICIGGSIGWLIGIPLMGADPSAGSALDQAWELWSTKIRYVGVGTMVVGGVNSIWRVRGSLRTATEELVAQFKTSHSNEMIPRTQQNISGKLILGLSALCIVLTAGVYFHVLSGRVGITILTTISMIVLSFFFTAVATYIVGLVGSSNSPVSGMTICAVLVTGGLLYLFEFSGTEGMIATLGVAGIVCCVACTAGDTSNDLKTGLLVGASPRSQQIMQVLGVIAAAFIMAPVLVAIHEGSINAGEGGIGGRMLPAPQAGLFAALAQGFFGDGKLPWDMIGWGLGIGVVILVLDAFLAAGKKSFRLHVMPVAVGIYLPLGLSVPILAGGFIHYFVTRANKADGNENDKKGILVSSGVIAGESLMGVALAILAYMQVIGLKFGESMYGHVGMEVVAILAIVALMVWMYVSARAKRE